MAIQKPAVLLNYLEDLGKLLKKAALDVRDERQAFVSV